MSCCPFTRVGSNVAVPDRLFQPPTVCSPTSVPAIAFIFSSHGLKAPVSHSSGAVFLSSHAKKLKLLIVGLTTLWLVLYREKCKMFESTN